MAARDKELIPLAQKESDVQRRIQTASSRLKEQRLICQFRFVIVATLK